ncbi:hypothetical protein RhiJN_21388 [Ceratobasidium sp. AG-Ba]|nr:hypothetical protein RhiJN_21388 [Ceratobasidium sp. AG-Ba]
MRFSIPSFALIAAALALAQPQARQDHPASLNPPPEFVKDIDWPAFDAASAAAPEPATNAQRLARGLPLIKPKAHRRHFQRGGPHRLGSRALSAPRAETSPSPPAHQKCNILVKTDNTTLGYLKAQFNKYGEYGAFTSEQNLDTLEVSFSYSPDSPSQFDMLVTNSPSKTFSNMGGVVGYNSDGNDLGPGSSNYLYIAGTKQSPPGSVPMDGESSYSATMEDATTEDQPDYESAIWAYDPVTQAIAAHWINTDGSTVATHIAYANDGSDSLVLVGDLDSFNKFLGTSYPEVTMKCVPPTTTAPPPPV